MLSHVSSSCAHVVVLILLDSPFCSSPSLSSSFSFSWPSSSSSSSCGLVRVELIPCVPPLMRTWAPWSKPSSHRLEIYEQCWLHHCFWRLWIISNTNCTGKLAALLQERGASANRTQADLRKSLLSSSSQEPRASGKLAAMFHQEAKIRET